MAPRAAIPMSTPETLLDGRHHRERQRNIGFGIARARLHGRWLAKTVWTLSAIKTAVLPYHCYYSLSGVKIHVSNGKARD